MFQVTIDELKELSKFLVLNVLGGSARFSTKTFTSIVSSQHRHLLVLSKTEFPPENRIDLCKGRKFVPIWVAFAEELIALMVTIWLKRQVWTRLGGLLASIAFFVNLVTEHGMSSGSASGLIHDATEIPSSSFEKLAKFFVLDVICSWACFLATYIAAMIERMKHLHFLLLSKAIPIPENIVEFSERY
jgi:hypothetical protein